ncbi:mRNA cleavage and polyadenylation specificity factor-like protein [Halovivax gelatinilyticus]|uniref:mRNA cleavage and polyadenylation specificity factor-like protein n=1 Tax=Halovivax gelatinilyticus TaxID=2961597 RepID=UPI0020CA47B6|nr:mRNA cleavage and polyadenylation specificity factor-like protein [Halovivax gelatinilyticus]
MNRRVTHRDGIHFDVGRLVVADARSAAGDVNVVSHAHADHTFSSSPETVVCSTETAAIATARTGVDFDFVESAPGIDLVPAGHVVGSRAAIIEAGDGTRYCYTGDFSTRDRAYLDGFDPSAIEADVLVMETTYGHPRYRFPPQAELDTAIREWIREHDDRPLFLFGYSLGRAQKVQWLAREAADRDVLVTSTIDDVNRAIASATDLEFSGRPTDPDELRERAGVSAERSTRDPLTDEIVVLPSNQSRRGWVDEIAESTGALKAGFSGWAVDDSYRYRGGYDVTFPLTDHCDFDELIATVEAIDPDLVYTHHGYDEAFADVLATEYGYDSQPLKRNQTTLGDFGR